MMEIKWVATLGMRSADVWACRSVVEMALSMVWSRVEWSGLWRGKSKAVVSAVLWAGRILDVKDAE